MPKNRLTDITVKEISFVDDGDNPGAYILLYKKKDAILRKEDYMEEMEKLQADLKASQDDLAKANSTIKELTKTVDELKKSKTPVDEEAELLKSLPESMRKRIEEAEAIAKAKEEELAKVKDEAETKEWMQKSKDAGLTDEDSAMFKSLAKSNKDVVGKVFERMSQLQKAVEEGELLKEKGQAIGNENDPMAKVKADALEIRKSDPKLSEAQAFAKAWELNKGDM